MCSLILCPNNKSQRPRFLLPWHITLFLYLHVDRMIWKKRVKIWNKVKIKSCSRLVNMIFNIQYKLLSNDHNKHTFISLWVYLLLVSVRVFCNAIHIVFDDILCVIHMNWESATRSFTSLNTQNKLLATFHTATMWFQCCVHSISIPLNVTVSLSFIFDELRNITDLSRNNGINSVDYVWYEQKFPCVENNSTNWNVSIHKNAFFHSISIKAICHITFTAPYLSFTMIFLWFDLL